MLTAVARTDRIGETSPMTKADESWFDTDIQLLDLEWGEKAGLQIYRNYTRSFEDHAISKFREALNREEIDLIDLKKLIELLGREDLRILPVVTCGYADELLKVAFQNTIPSGVPGGIKEMTSGYGPLSDLSKRIRLAYAFDVLSSDLMEALDKIRSVRNRISHDWDVTKFVDFHQTGQIADLFPIEAHLSDRAHEFPEFSVDLEPSSIFRIRLIWIVGRLTYEVKAYHRAKSAHLSPIRALYESGGTSWLKSVATVCLEETRAIIGRSVDSKKTG